MCENTPAPGRNPHEAEEDLIQGNRHSVTSSSGKKSTCVQWNNFRNQDLKQEACERIIAAFALLDIQVDL